MIVFTFSIKLREKKSFKNLFLQNFLEPRKEPHEGVVLENKVRNAVQSYLNEVYHQTRPNQSNPAYLPQPAFRPKLDLDTTTKFVPQYRGELSLI